MSHTLHVPEIGADGKQIIVGTWLIDTGEEVFAGERLVELQLPGLLYVVPAEAGGTLTRIHAQTGAKVHEGDPLGSIELSKEGAES